MPKPWEKYGKPWEKYSAPAEQSPKAMQTEQRVGAELGSTVARTTGNPLLGIAAKTGAEAISNIPASAYSFGEGIVNAALSPIETGKNIVKTVAGGVEKLVGIDGESVKNFDALTNYFSQRYGNPSAIRETIAADPVGFAADLSTFLGGASGLARSGGLAKTSGILSSAAGATDPLAVAGKTVGLSARAIPKSVPTKLYGSAAKLSTEMDAVERASKIATGLKEGIVPAQSGLIKLQSEVDKINGRIGAIIDKAKNAGKTVDVNAVADAIESTKPFYENTTNPAKYLEELDNLKAEFINHPKAVNGKIPIDVAQKIKQNTYVLLRNAYGEISTVAKEGQKALARGIKEEIAKQFPEINELNARESALLKLEPEIERAIGRIGNRDVIGIGTGIAGQAARAAGATGVQAGAAIIAKSIIDSPRFKANLAIALNNARKGKPIRQTTVTPIGAVANMLNQQSGN